MKYRQRSIELLEGNNIDFSLPIHMQIKHQTSYNCIVYGIWSSSLLIPNVGTEFSCCGKNYMITKSKIDAANIGLFFVSHVFFLPTQSVELIPFCGHIYCHSYTWILLNTNIVFPCIICAWIVILLETLIGKMYYI